jgi:tetratricopeptide (TPR) repeat protein
MHVFSFYSFKGGVGRSLALINVAYSLASRGRNVLVLDMDLEAPGISGFLTRSGELPDTAERDTLDLLAWAVDASNIDGSEGDPIGGPPIEEFTSRVPAEKLVSPRLGKAGSVNVIGLSRSRNYPLRLESILNALRESDLVRVGSTLRAYLISRKPIVETVPDYYASREPRSFPYDYVLVDSRTGLTEVGGLCIGPLADRLVVFTGLNDQNISGTADLLRLVGITENRSLSEPWDKDDVPASSKHAPPRLGPKPCLVVASPVPIGEHEQNLVRLAVLSSELGSSHAAEIAYSPVLSLTEKIVVRELPDEYISIQYNKLCDRVMESVADSSPQLAEEAHRLSQSKKQKGDALRNVLRLVPANPDLGESFLLNLTETIDRGTENEYELLDQALRILSHPSSNYTYIGLCRWAYLLSDWALIQRGHPDRSSRLLNLSIDRSSQVIEAAYSPAEARALARLYRATASMRANREAKALVDLNAILSDDSSPVENRSHALVWLGDLELDKGDYERASALLKDAIKYNPYWYRGYALLGLCFFFSGRTEEAIEALRDSNARTRNPYEGVELFDLVLSRTRGRPDHEKLLTLGLGGRRL